MAEIGLHRPEQERILGGSILAVNVDERVDLDGVAEGRPRAVSLNVVDLARGESAGGQRLLQQGALRGAVGHGESGGRAVMVDGAPANGGDDGIAVTLRIGKAFEHDESAAFTASVAIGCRVEGFATAIGG